MAILKVKKNETAWPTLGCKGSAHPMARMAMQNAVGGTATGFTFATVGSLAYGNSLSASVEAGMQGAATGFAAGAITGAGMSIPYARANNVNPFTGRSTLRPELPQAPLNTTEISKGVYDRRNYTSTVDGGESSAINEWNNILKQYPNAIIRGDIPNQSFVKMLPDGSKVMGRIYFGGNTNPGGYNIKVITKGPPQSTRIPPVYIRYINAK